MGAKINQGRAAETIEFLRGAIEVIERHKDSFDDRDRGVLAGFLIMLDGKCDDAREGFADVTSNLLEADNADELGIGVYGTELYRLWDDVFVSGCPQSIHELDQEPV